MGVGYEDNREIPISYIKIKTCTITFINKSSRVDKDQDQVNHFLLFVPLRATCLS